MKNLSGALSSHLDGTLTTISTCWKITRDDGAVRGFTDHDRELTIDGIVYVASSGYFRTAIANSAGTSVDNMDVRGFLDSEHIDETELRNGKYDYAAVEIFAVNWRDLSMGVLPLRAGFFGETQITPSGLFKIELRGLTQLYAQTIGDIYQPECRVDLGDSKCRIKLLPDVRKSNSSYALGDRVLVPAITGDNLALPLTNAGFESGAVGWGGSQVVVENIFYLSAYEGTKFLHLELAEGQQDLKSQTVNISGLSLDLSGVDQGRYKAEFKGFVTADDQGQKYQFEIAFRDADNILISTTTENFVPVPQPFIWSEHTFTATVPSGTRYVTVGMRGWNDSNNKNVGPCFDAMSARIYDQDYEYSKTINYLTFGGVEYECTVAGTTADAASLFSTTLDDVIVDGTLSWTVVAPTYTFLDTIATVTSNSVFTLSSLTNADSFFEWGVLEYLEGTNQGKRIEIKNWDSATKQVTTALPLPFLPVAGQRVRMQAGCNKSRAICNGTFANIINFRGEPDIPGTDQYFKVGGANTAGET